MHYSIIIIYSAFLLIFGTTINTIEIPVKIRKAVQKHLSIKVGEFHEIETEEMNNTHFYEITDGNSSKGYLCIRQTNACRIGGCSIDSIQLSSDYFSSAEEYERFTYFFITDKEFVIQKSGVYKYPGDYGFEICSRWWQKQFTGYKGQDWEYGVQVDGITGATISGYAMCYDLQIAYHELLILAEH